jgi:hypothetical protein
MAADTLTLDSYRELTAELEREMMDDFRILESIALQGAALQSRRL